MSEKILVPVLGESITDARRISHDLTPPLLEQTDIADLIENIILEEMKVYEISIDNKSNGIASGGSFTGLITIAICYSLSVVSPSLDNVK